MRQPPNLSCTASVVFVTFVYILTVHMGRGRGAGVTTRSKLAYFLDFLADAAPVSSCGNHAVRHFNTHITALTELKACFFVYTVCTWAQDERAAADLHPSGTAKCASSE
jgi:hypothetical protein